VRGEQESKGATYTNAREPGIEEALLPRTLRVQKGCETLWVLDDGEVSG